MALRGRDLVVGEAKVTLDVAIGRYWSEHAQHLPSAPNLWDYAENWKRIGAERKDENGHPTPLLQKQLHQITNDDISWYVGRRRGERVKNATDGAFVSNRTVNADVEFLRSVFNRAFENWDIDIGRKPPKWGNHLLPVPEERVRSASDDEYDAIHAAIVKLRPDFLDWILFAGISGRREAEVFDLEKRYVDRTNMRYAVWEKGVRGKQGKRLRWYQMSVEQLEIINRNWMRHPTLVFTYVAKQSVHNPKRNIRIHRGLRYPFTKDGWRRAWAEILTEAKVSDFRIHDWRHDFATRVLAKTGNLKLVKELLGHTTIATTSKYAHVGDEATRGALADIGAGRVKKAESA